MRQDKKLSTPLINIENLNLNIQVNVNSTANQTITSNRNEKEESKKSHFFEKLKKMLVKFVTEIDVNVIVILSELIFTLLIK